MTDFYNQNSLLLNQLAISALLALSIYITLSAAMLSLANAAFMGLAAYSSALCSQHFGWQLLPALLLGGLVAAVVALPLGAPVLRLRGVFLAIATIGFGEVLRVVVTNAAIPAFGYKIGNIDQAYPGGAEGLRLSQPPLTNGWYSYGALLALIYFFWRLRGSRMGRALAAIREDETAAESIGVDVRRYKLIAFVLSAFIAGWAGGLSAHLYAFINPNDFGFSRAVDILTYAVVGGTFSFVGPILGALLITSLPELLRFLQEYRQVFSGAVLLLVILFLPGGLFGLFSKVVRGKRTLLVGIPPAFSPPGLVSEAGGTAGGDEPASLRPPEPLAEPLLQISHLSRRFGGVIAVDDVSLTVARGDVFGLIGPNGAGKTTLVNLISGVLAPSGGQISFKGQVINGLPPHRLSTLGLARTYQNIRLFPTLSVLDNVLVGLHGRTRSNLLARLFFSRRVRAEEQHNSLRAMELLYRFGLHTYAYEPAASLSYGDQRRLEMARALATGPTMLLLDEPAAGLNNAETATLRELLRQFAAEGITILLIEHDMPLVMGVCDEVAVLNFGRKLAEDTPARISSDPQVIEAYLGSE